MKRPGWRVASAVVAACVLGAAWYTPTFIRGSSFFRIRSVEVVGLDHLRASDVVSQLALPANASILIDAEQVRVAAKEIAGLRSVSVSRRWPGTLRLEVVEAPAVALVDEGDSLVVMDDRGERLPYPVGRLRASLPLSTADPAAALLLGRLRVADPEWYLVFDRAVGDGDDLHLIAGGRTIRLRGDTDERTLRTIAAVRRYLDSTGVEWRTLDARFRGRVFVRRGAV